MNVAASATPVVVTPAGGQDLVANGLVFDHEGDLIVADTARGALWRIEFDGRGHVTSRMGCDAAFAPDTLCLENIFVAHPLIEGTDGIALDRKGNIWNAANERNAIVVVTRDGRVIEIFRNPLNAAGLRNSADPAVGNDRILDSRPAPSWAATACAWPNPTETGATTPRTPEGKSTRAALWARAERSRAWISRWMSGAKTGDMTSPELRSPRAPVSKWGGSSGHAQGEN